MSCTVSSLFSLARLRSQGCGVVVTKRRLMVQTIVVTDELPADFVVVTAVCGACQESDNCVRADRVEERRVLDLGEHFDLLRRAERREFTSVREKLTGLRLKILQPLNVGRLLGSVESG